MIKLAIDAMGGDFAPKEQVEGAMLAIQNIDDIEITLYDLNGRSIDSQYFVPNTSIFEHTFDYSSLTNGVYFLKITNGKEKAC